MGRFMLQPIANDPAELEIPVVYSLEFANDLVMSLGDAFERAYPETAALWEEDIIDCGKGRMSLKIPVRLCRLCGKPIMQGRAWAFSWNDAPGKKFYEYFDAAKRYGFLEGPCCENGRDYNRMRDKFFIRHLDKILVSLKEHIGIGNKKEPKNWNEKNG